MAAGPGGGGQLGDLLLQVGVGAVGRGGGVGLDLGAVQGDQPQADQAGRRAQLQRLDQQAGQGLFVADPEGDVFMASPLDLAGGADPVQ